MRALVIAASACCALLAACTTDREPCSPFNCGGCCFNGGCFAGTVDNLCGAGGEVCSSCAGGEACFAGECLATTPDDGGPPRDTGPRDVDPRDDTGEPPGDAGTPDAPAGDAPNPDAFAPDAAAPDADPVRGTRVLHYFTESGEIPVAPDLTQSTISAIVGSGAATMVLPGIGRADGTIEIPNVPAGEYIFRMNDAYVVTSERVLILDRWYLGRPDAALSALTTNITFDLRNLEPWTGSSILELYSTNSNASDGSLISGTGPMAGATQFVFTENWSTLERPALPDSALGDAIILSQFSFRTMPVNHWGVTRSATVLGATIRDGQAATIIANFTAVPLIDLDLDWRINTFEALATAIHPLATFIDHRLYVDSIPGGLAHGRFGNPPIIGYLDRAAGTGNFAMTFSFGNPYPGSAASPAYLAVFELAYQLPGTTARVLNPAIRQGSSVAAVDGVPMVPLLSPPGDVRINGLLASTSRTGLGERPTLSWAPPATGVPDFYAIDVFRLRNVGGATTESFEARLTTRSTSITLPPGIFTTGNTYFILVAAQLSGGVNPRLTPFLRGYPDVIVPAFTGILSP